MLALPKPGGSTFHPRRVRVWAISSQLDPDAAELKNVEQSRSRVGLCETPLKIKEIAMLV